MAAKGAREKIRLVCSAETGHFYTTDKNKRNMPEKMEIKNFNTVARKHVIYREAMDLSLRRLWFVSQNYDGKFPPN